MNENITVSRCDYCFRLGSTYARYIFQLLTVQKLVTHSIKIEKVQHKLPQFYHLLTTSKKTDLFFLCLIMTEMGYDCEY